MANEFRKVTDQNGVDHPVCDDTRVDWASYAKTGAKNRFDILQNYLYTNKVNETKTSNSIRIVGTESAVYENVSYALQNLAKNTEYIFSADVVVSVGAAQLIVTGGSSTSGPWTDITASTSLTSNGKLSIRFNSANYTYIKLAFMCSLATAAVGDVTYSNIMIYDASDNDTAYAPYAMTNKELTEEIEIVKSGLAHSSGYNDNKTEIIIPNNFGPISAGVSLLLFVKHYTSATTFAIRMAYVTFYMNNNVLTSSVNMLIDDNNLPAITKVESTADNYLKVTFASGVYATIQAIMLADRYF